MFSLNKGGDGGIISWGAKHFNINYKITTYLEQAKHKLKPLKCIFREIKFPHNSRDNNGFQRTNWYPYTMFPTQRYSVWQMAYTTMSYQ